MLWLLVLASLPIGFVGLLFKDAAETTLRNPVIIGTMLIAVGILMLVRGTRWAGATAPSAGIGLDRCD